MNLTPGYLLTRELPLSFPNFLSARFYLGYSLSTYMFSIMASLLTLYLLNAVVLVSTLAQSLSTGISTV